MSTHLAHLAAAINDAHAAAEHAMNDALQHARRCGELLMQAKAQCAHGEWLPWLGANFRASERTARGYMSLARRWDELPTQNGNALPIRDALAALAEPRPTVPAVAEAAAVPPLPKTGREALAILDGVVIVIEPSAHAGFFYVTSWWGPVGEIGELEGTIKPIPGEYVGHTIDTMLASAATYNGVGRGTRWTDARWTEGPTDGERTFNRFLFTSHDDYMRRHVLATGRA
jgi:hypothetical protein